MLVLLALLAAVPQPAGAVQTGFKAEAGDIDVSKRDIAAGNFGARRDTISGWRKWKEAKKDEYEALVTSDNDRYVNKKDAKDGDNSAMLFEVEFDDDRRLIGQVEVSVELSQESNVDSIYVFIWDYDAGRYEVLGSMSGTSDRLLDIALTDSPSRYLSIDGQLTVFAVNQHDDGDDSRIRTDRISVQLQSLASHFSISHSGSMTTCEVSEITIEKHDSGHALETGVTGAFDITTSTGIGSWSVVTGDGTLVDKGGGSATYTYADSDVLGSVSLGLAHPQTATVDIDVVGGGVGELESEDPGLVVSAPGAATVRDEFNSASYTGNDGSANWSGPWVEIGESNGVSGNHVTVSSGRCSSGRCLRIGTSFSSRETFRNRGAVRAVDLSSATSATLTLQYLRGHVRGSGTASLAVSRDGGASFRTIGSTRLNGNTTSPISVSFDITAYASANTQIRFLASVNNGTASIYIDNIQISYETTCPSGGHFELSHDGAGVHCQSEPFSVSARGADDALRTDYAETVTLSTGTGFGTFESDASNAGSFSDPVAGDGLASYTFARADAGSALFSLNYSGGGGGGGSIDVDVYQSNDKSIADDDREGRLTFGPSGFQLTATAIPTPAPNPVDDPIGTRIAGRNFRVHIAAYGTSSANPSCGVVESYVGPKTLQFWTDYDDPASGTRSLAINNRAVGASEATARSVALDFTKGRAVFATEYKDVGRIRLHAKDATGSASGGAIVGSSDSFLNKPADFAVVDVQRPDLTDNPRIDVPTGEVFVAAGSPFRATVRVLDDDGDLTPNFGLESNPEAVRIYSGELVAPLDGRNGVLDDGAIGNGSSLVAAVPAGTFVATELGFDEVGAIRLRAAVADGDYMGGGEVIGGPSEIVGRFIPSRFEVATNTPEWQTACGIGAFTWAGQPFGYSPGSEPQITVRAVNAAGTTTQNYTGDWWRLSNDSLGPRVYSTNSGTLDEEGMPLPSSDPGFSSVASGEGLLTFSSGAGAAIERTPLAAPFDVETELSVDIVDLDGVAYASNPVVFGGTAPGTGIAFDVSNRIQFGRLRIENAFGSELVDLPMKMVTQRFDGSAFVDDDSDSCSAISVSELALAPNPGTVASTPTIGNDPLFAGNAALEMGAPNEVGSVGIVVDLGPSGANLPWLQYDWPRDGNLDGVLDDNPSAEATFGIWPGRPGMIYQREIY